MNYSKVGNTIVDWEGNIYLKIPYEVAEKLNRFGYDVFCLSDGNIMDFGSELDGELCVLIDSIKNTLAFRGECFNSLDEVMDYIKCYNALPWGISGICKHHLWHRNVCERGISFSVTDESGRTLKFCRWNGKGEILEHE